MTTYSAAISATARLLAALGVALPSLPSAAQATVEPPTRQVVPVRAAVTVPWRAIEASASFIEGHAGPLIAAFIDLDCGVCSHLWRRVRAPMAAGRIRVRWIPVALVQPSGAWRAAALLRAADPVAALAAHESRVLAMDTEVAVTAAPTDDIAANGALLVALTRGRSVTPLLVWRAADLTLRVSPGLPQDLGAVLAGAH